MTSEVLALGSALAFGAGDFLGGLASRTAPPRRVTAVAQIASAVVLIPLVFAVPSPQVTQVDLLWGAVGGLFGLLGLLLLFSALGEGPMGIVAPITAVVSAIVPVSFGLATGERPGTPALVGMALGILGIVAVTLSDGPSGRASTRVVLMSLVAGLGFAFFFVALAQTDVDAGMWPLAGARLVTVPVILLIALPATSRRSVSRVGLRLAIGSGVLDMVANALFLSAAQRGLLAVAAVLSALYPATTVLLARVVLQERMSSAQLLGVGGAVAAVILIGLPA